MTVKYVNCPKRVNKRNGKGATAQSMVGTDREGEHPVPKAGRCDRASSSGAGETEPRAPGGLGAGGSTPRGKPHFTEALPAN